MTIQELEQIITLYGKEIYSFCLHLTKNRMTADELYQDTFLTVAEQTDKLNTDGNPKSYFLSVALKLWKNRRRKYAWRQRIAPSETRFENIQEHILGVKDDALQDYLKKEQRQIVEQAVFKLKEKYRIPILLYYMEEMSVAEVADVIGIPQGTVKSRLSTARKYLESELEDYFYE